MLLAIAFGCLLLLVGLLMVVWFAFSCLLVCSFWLGLGLLGYLLLIEFV